MTKILKANDEAGNNLNLKKGLGGLGGGVWNLIFSDCAFEFCAHRRRH